MSLASSFPDENTTSEVKRTKEWLRQFARAAYNCYGDAPLNSIGWKSRDRYMLIDSYADGRQTVDKYKKMLVPGDDPSNNRLAVDWSPIQVLPKFLGIAVALVDKNGYNIEVNPIDPLAKSELSDMIEQMRAKLQIKDQMTQMGLGDYLSSAVLQPEPGEAEDLDGLEAMQMGIRHRTAMDAEQVVQYMFNQNDFQFIRYNMIKDWIRKGVAICKDDRRHNRAVIRRCHPERVIMNFCYKEDFSDLKYIGEMELLLASQVVYASSGQVTKEEVEEVYKKANMNSTSWGSPTPFYGYSGFSDFWQRGKLYVLDLEIITTDIVEREERVNPKGNLKFTAPKYNDERRRRRADNGSKFYTKSIQNVYRVKWVVGTDIVYDYGLQYNMKRDPLNQSVVIPSYHITACDFKDMLAYSRAEALITHADAIQLALLKLQHTLNTVVPKGYAINFDAIESVSLDAGGRKMTPRDILDLFFERGILIQRQQNLPGGGTNNAMPIIPLEGGVGSELTECWVVINNRTQMIRDTLGLNELTDASTPDEKTLTKVAQAAQQGTNNALYSVFQADKQMMQKIVRSSIIRAQDIICTGGEQDFVNTLGIGTVTILKNIKDIVNYTYSVEIKDLPNDVEVQAFLQQVQVAQEQGQITVADVLRMNNITNLKMKEQYLAYAVKKNMDRAQQQKMQDVQANAQAQQQSAQVAEQAKQQTLQMEYQLKMQLEQMKADLEQRNDIGRGELMLERERIASTGRVEASFVQATERQAASMRDNTTKLITDGRPEGIAIVNQPAELKSNVAPATDEQNPILPIPGFSFLDQPVEEQGQSPMEQQPAAAPAQLQPM